VFSGGTVKLWVWSAGRKCTSFQVGGQMS